MSEASAAPPPDKRTASSSRRSVASQDLFQGHRELVIVHRDQEYRLRITRTGKLILTK